MPSRPDKILFGSVSVSPDYPPALASRRYSGADKKEEQERKQQQRSRERQPVTAVTFGGDDGFGALAHGHAKFRFAAQIVLDSRAKGKAGRPVAPRLNRECY